MLSPKDRSSERLTLSQPFVFVCLRSSRWVTEEIRVFYVEIGVIYVREKTTRSAEVRLTITKTTARMTDMTGLLGSRERYVE